MQKTTNYQLPRWEKTDRILMDDFNGMTAALAAKGNCRIQAGSYTGTWTWGEDGKNTIACSGVPLLLLSLIHISMCIRDRPYTCRGRSLTE